jgi:hypothetical protein
MPRIGFLRRQISRPGLDLPAVYRIASLAGLVLSAAPFCDPQPPVQSDLWCVAALRDRPGPGRALEQDRKPILGR